MKLPLPPVFIAAVLLLVVGLPIAYLSWPAPTPPPAALSVSALESIRLLHDHEGTAVVENGKWPAEGWTLVFFGFTHCADACPTTLVRVRDALNQLGDGATQLTPTFITLDPERDSAGRLKAYLGFFDPRIQGLTGTPTQIRRVVDAWGLYARRVEVGDTYLLDHSTVLFLLDDRGQLVGVLSGQLDAVALADEIRQLMGRG